MASAIDLVLYGLARGVMLLLAALPLGAALALGRALGAFAYHGLRIRRRVVLGNLRYVLGGSKSERELRAIARAAYRELGMTVVEVLRYSVVDPARQASPIDLAALEPLVERQRRGAPVVVCSPHHGNFDLLGFAAGRAGLEVHAIMKPLKSARFNRLLVGARERFGLRMHMHGADSFQEMFELLFDGKMVALLPDQRPRKYGVVVDFLGRPAETFQGPAVLHLVTEAELVVAVAERLREDPRRHRVHLAFLPPHQPSGDRSADVLAATRRICDAMGEVILRSPEQYFWFHRRWGRAALDEDADRSARLIPGPGSL
jgi:KDO2-lipid IV(A) lauroyltransferase